MAAGSGVYGIVVHRRGGVDDAVAAVEGSAEAGPVEQVHLQHGEALRRAVERPQVRVLGVIWRRQPNRIGNPRSRTAAATDDSQKRPVMSAT